MDGFKEKIEEKVGLLTSSHSYKPFRYPWAYDFWKRQQQVHWMPEEVPLGEDCKDWAVKLNDNERNLLTQIFRFFTQSDVEVNDNLHKKLYYLHLIFCPKTNVCQDLHPVELVDYQKDVQLGGNYPEPQ